MARVRRHLHGERAIDPSCTEVIAYWRQGPAGPTSSGGPAGTTTSRRLDDLTVRQVDR
jgi:hypothetical protein